MPTTLFKRPADAGVERGVRNISVTVAARLAKALHILPHQLLEPLPKKGKAQLIGLQDLLTLRARLLHVFVE